MRLNNVCLLATNHNICKAYIEALTKEGFSLSNVLYINIVGNKKKSLKKKLYTRLISLAKIYLPNSLLNLIRQNKAKHLLSDHELLTNKLKPIFRDKLSDNGLYFVNYGVETPLLLKNMNIPFRYLTVNSINDESLAKYLKEKISEKYVIFSGGGIVRKPMFETGKRFIHIHPGIVPEVKGSDCLLWSALVRKKLGMSAFFMNAGIDTGDIIKTKEYPIPKFELQLEPHEIKILPGILINYIDPSYRANLLVSLFKENNNPDKWVVSPQKSMEGKFYYFMHPKISSRAVINFMKNEHRG